MRNQQALGSCAWTQATVVRPSAVRVHMDSIDQHIQKKCSLLVGILCLQGVAGKSIIIAAAAAAAAAAAVGYVHGAAC